MTAWADYPKRMLKIKKEEIMINENESENMAEILTSKNYKESLDTERGETMTNGNEELKNLLETLELKLGKLAEYESELIIEADMLKNMYERMAIQVKETQELLKEFSKEKYVFFRDFNERIDRAIENSLNNSLSGYDLQFTLVKGDSND